MHLKILLLSVYCNPDMIFEITKSTDLILLKVKLFINLKHQMNVSENKKLLKFMWSTMPV